MEPTDLLKQERTTNPVASMSVFPEGVCFESQDKGEDIFLLLRPHWITNFPWLLNLVLGLLLPFIIAGFLSYYKIEFFDTTLLFALWVFWYMMLMTYAFSRFLRWYFNAYIITNQRVVDLDYFGLLHHRMSEASLDKIEDVTSGHIGIWQNLFDYGNVYIQTAAVNSEFTFDYVPRPGFVQDKIMDLVDLYVSKSKDI